MHKIKNTLAACYRNFRGWTTNRKIVVFESDDWGSIRMPSKEVYHKLLEKGIRVDKCPYNQYDSLASREDLDSLFNVLIKFKDRNGNHPVITANTVVANPDFDKILQSDYKAYFFEPFTETLKKYPAHQNSFKLWKQGMKEKLFHPQFHGREHLNVNRWMNALRHGSEETLVAFKFKMFGISANISNENRKSYMAALDFDTETELEQQKDILKSGLDLFETIFGYNSDSFIAPNYVWHSLLEGTLHQNGVKYIQGSNQNQPTAQGTKVIRHTLGEKNGFNQIFMNRNCVFEPSSNPDKNWVDSVLKEIGIAFFWGKPATITSHRVNYIGFIDSINRERNLALLENLLKEILSKWPEVEFMTSDGLGNFTQNN